MANIVVETTAEEQKAVLKALKELEGQVAAVSIIAEKAGLKQSRVRYVLVDLLESGKIERTRAKAFNTHYIRYTYTVL